MAREVVAAVEPCLDDGVAGDGAPLVACCGVVAVGVRPNGAPAERGVVESEFGSGSLCGVDGESIFGVLGDQ